MEAQIPPNPNTRAGRWVWAVCVSAAWKLEGRLATSASTQELGHSNAVVTLVTEARHTHRSMAPSSVLRPLGCLLCFLTISHEMQAEQADGSNTLCVLFVIALP